MAGRGLILAAPSSGSGKTIVALGLLRALSRAGIPVRGAKSGPDYIDPAFHAAACGAESVNLDAWAMAPAQLRRLAAGDGLLIVEGAMGLFDGAPPEGRGSVADLAQALDLPVVLVVDAGRMAQSVAPLVAGFAGFRPGLRVAGVILNRVGSERHAAMLRRALGGIGMPVLGALRRDPGLDLPSRHLGLVQAGELVGLEEVLERAADAVAAGMDLPALDRLALPLPEAPTVPAPPTPKRIAVARDAAFSFLYPHQVAAWRAGGAELIFFSPLQDDPVPEADLVHLPGGYPELHAARLAGNARFMQSLRDAAHSSDIYGECGGYMVLGERLVDADGRPHRMAGLLGLATSFAERRLHLGYRRLVSRGAAMPGAWRGHEFHYATTLSAEGMPLFDAEDAEGAPLGPAGLVEGRVAGSFAHLVAPEALDGAGADA
ncbi:cobyrinate a,c-diamide synthase [Wenxinia saemankumensis]|uniref:Hydrogenobyrinate a,c-diamide synthase n=1 Tax=Wenxinia saemankumensis TaxID=1447782 RepID=A0A1M6A0C1_9RHOB|nr:cobyrinate a,c-diamide synthase [Wenxinia saemankumensis]SHI29603.1 cobyrinic acid a,c-diamide synthase [Wenxinia saemankumensis]